MNTTATTTSTPGHPLRMACPLLITPEDQKERGTTVSAPQKSNRKPCHFRSVRVGVAPPVLSYTRRLRCSYSIYLSRPHTFTKNCLVSGPAPQHVLSHGRAVLPWTASGASRSGVWLQSISD